MKLKSEKLSVAGRELIWGSRTYVMGILNITADSFSGDGLLGAEDPVGTALELGRRFVDSGADILDIGGESTRPGARAIAVDEELSRVLPIIRAVASELDVIICIDSYRAEVAAAALEAGSHMINDVWGLRADPAMAPLVAERGVPVILMHNRSRSGDASLSERLGGRYVGVEYSNLLEEIQEELHHSVALAHSAGIQDKNILIDPGVGFGKTVDQNLELLNRLSQLRALGYPIVLGTSRKSFIGYTLDLPPAQRVEGTAATIAIGIDRGADVVRVHDVEAMVRVARMSDAIVRRT